MALNRELLPASVSILLAISVVISAWIDLDQTRRLDRASLISESSSDDVNFPNADFWAYRWYRRHICTTTIKNSVIYVCSSFERGYNSARSECCFVD
jgi:hypothetical protein